MLMWWNKVQDLGRQAPANNRGITDPSAVVASSAILNEATGPISIGARTRICAGAIIEGPVQIGSDCLIGTNALVRGPCMVGDDVRIGYAAELKQAQIGSGVRIGPMCFVADSIVDTGAYLGAMVRTSNHRLDGKPVTVIDEEGAAICTQQEKLGCWIGAGTALGIQVIVLPGRVVPPDSIFEPRMTIARNHPPGRYRLIQAIESY